MPKFSLIVATVERTSELERFLESLDQQHYTDYELILVDQNSDDRLSHIVERFSANHPCIHLRCSPGVSKARNMGLSFARGQLIGFPDDDCWYPVETLSNVDCWFGQYPDYGIVSLTVRDETGVRSANRWHEDSCDLGSLNIFRTSATYTFFVRRDHWKNTVLFDETLGPASGTLFGAAEDTDFVLSLMASGVRGRFVSKWFIGHPRRDMFSGHVRTDRALSYGLGMGRVLRKHSLFLLGIALFGFDLFRTVMSFLRGNFRAATLCWAHGKGMLSGYLASREKLKIAS